MHICTTIFWSTRVSLSIYFRGLPKQWCLHTTSTVFATKLYSLSRLHILSRIEDRVWIDLYRCYASTSIHFVYRGTKLSFRNLQILEAPQLIPHYSYISFLRFWNLYRRLLTNTLRCPVPVHLIRLPTFHTYPATTPRWYGSGNDPVYGKLADYRPIQIIINLDTVQARILFFIVRAMCMPRLLDVGFSSADNSGYSFDFFQTSHCIAISRRFWWKSS